jgi:thiamine-monophosphate kinase
MSNAPFSSEDQFLAAISGRFPNVHPHMILGRGDDCAAIACPETTLLTTDLFIEDVHFKRAYFSPEDVGHKALAVNASDMAAMGGLPLGFSLGLAGPPSTPAAYWERVLDGMAALAGDLDIPLVGGDLNACDRIVLAVTLWGAPGPTGRVLGRGGCQTGDVLFVIGDLGLAACGLEVLNGKGPDAAKEFPDSAAAHLRPEPRVKEGLAMARVPEVRGLMDVSDGLLRDLPRFLGPGLRADISIDRDTLHPELLALAKATGRDPAVMAVTGGEDYALLGACPREAFLKAYTQAMGVWAIGEVARGEGVSLDGKELPPGGFDHFG